MKDFTTQFKDHVRAKGADLVGIAPIERFAELPKERHPASIFPEARSVVVIGKRIVRGAIRGVEEGTNFDLYDMHGRNWLNNRYLAMTTLKSAEFLEDNGWEAVPLQDLPSHVPPMGIPVREGQPAPNVILNVNDAGVRAGLGEIGYCGFFLTPEFGPRQRFQMVLTDADLEPDALLETPVCDRCREHASFCILGAIDTAGEHVVSICGKEMTVAGIDYSKCISCKNGAAPNTLHPSGAPDRLAAICCRSCVSYLEEQGRLKNKFNEPFRKRPPWGMVGDRRI